ncbi:hypothetical protein Bbelb_278230 [Branchiostoma belcheri]|nr:hypothetical protein Bbelb_278230 [Branchiostoma belcheri]
MARDLAANANYAASADKPASVKACLTQAKRLSGGISTGDDSLLDLVDSVLTSPLGRRKGLLLLAPGGAETTPGRAKNRAITNASACSLLIFTRMRASRHTGGKTYNLMLCQGRDRASTLQASGSARRERSRGSCLFSRDANMSI